MTDSDSSFNFDDTFVGGSRKRKSAFQEAPKFVKAAGQRSGKWTEVEENYANQLVVDFERGFLDDCERGMTLRSYLARTLNCDPMRISKKFAGRCIGKLAYENCLTSSLAEKMKSPLNKLRAIYLAASSEDRREHCVKRGSSRSGRVTGGGSHGLEDYDYTFSYTDNEEDCSGSASDPGEDWSGNECGEESGEAYKETIRETGSVLDLVDFVNSPDIEGMYTFTGSGGQTLDEEWLHWQRYGVPGLLGKSESSAELKSVSVTRSEPSPTGISNGPVMLETQVIQPAQQF